MTFKNASTQWRIQDFDSGEMTQLWRSYTLPRGNKGILSGKTFKILGLISNNMGHSGTNIAQNLYYQF